MKVKVGDIIQNPSVSKEHPNYRSIVIKTGNTLTSEAMGIYSKRKVRYYTSDLNTNFKVIGKGHIEIIIDELYDSEHLD